MNRHALAALLALGCHSCLHDDGPPKPTSETGIIIGLVLVTTMITVGVISLLKVPKNKNVPARTPPR